MPSSPFQTRSTSNPTISSHLQSKIPTELIQHIFSMLRPSQALKFRRLCRRINECILHRDFALLSLKLYLQRKPSTGQMTPLDQYWFRMPTSYQIVYADVKLRTLGNLRLGWKSIEGVIPTSIGALQGLTVLMLGSNRLSGVVPKEVWGLKGLKMLDLSSNQLSGEISADVGGLVSLEALYLGSNAFGGVIPRELGQCRKLKVLSLCNNRISGGIPEELGNLPELSYLYLSRNRLTGGIPGRVCGALKQLRSLYLNNNELGKQVPVELGDLYYLDSLSLLPNLGMGKYIPAGILRGTRVWDLLFRDGFEPLP